MSTTGPKPTLLLLSVLVVATCGLVYELITRRRPNPKIEATIHMGGIMVLLVVMVLVTLRDFKLF